MSRHIAKFAGDYFLRLPRDMINMKHVTRIAWNKEWKQYMVTLHAAKGYGDPHCWYSSDDEIAILDDVLREMGDLTSGPVHPSPSNRSKSAKSSQGDKKTVRTEAKAKAKTNTKKPVDDFW